MSRRSLGEREHPHPRRGLHGRLARRERELAEGLIVPTPVVERRTLGGRVRGETPGAGFGTAGSAFGMAGSAFGTAGSAFGTAGSAFTNVPANARVVALAKAWLGDEAVRALGPL
jgi:hypothetical protein